ncbi:undecaprenyldiphospho-muramoylpentapeptide beta-N-acetylglucosaminyltransferase [soil metagenome]
MTFLIAAAGTGGHVFPGLAVGEALVGLGVGKHEILYAGGHRLEAEVYPQAGFSFEQFEIAGLKRRFALSNLGLPSMVVRVTRAVADLIDERKVTAVLGLGGYVTVPAAWAARRRKVPLFLAEQNAEAGLANRVTARWARRVFTAFPETAGLPDGHWVGNPIRSQLAAFDRAALRPQARAHYSIAEGETVVGVMGGSLGAALLNRIASSLAASRPSYTILNLAGGSHASAQEALARRSPAQWIVRDFEPRMELFYSAIDLVVARSGGVVAEYTATATPAVLVPGGFGSAGHQAANARALEAAGAALVVDEDDIDQVPAVVARALAQRAELIAGTKSLARPNAAADIARALLEAA